MKRAISLILAFAVLIGMLPMTVRAKETGLAASGTCGENVTWVLDEDGTMTISGTGAMAGYDWHGDRPWNDYKSSITTVVIQEGITEIGYQAFYWCKELTTVELPEGLKVIGASAFEECEKLTEVTIPDGVTKLDSSAFGTCGIKSINIPVSVTTLGYGVFEGCDDLTDLYYGGTKAQWDAISIGNGNSKLDDLTIHFAEEDSHTHCYTSEVTEPTCTEQGYTTCTCECSDSYVDDYVDAAGHSYGEWYETVAATTESGGEERRDCANCEAFETRIKLADETKSVVEQLDIIVDNKDSLTAEEIKTAVQRLDFDQLLIAMRSGEALEQIITLSSTVSSGSVELLFTENVPLKNNFRSVETGLALNNNISSDPIRIDQPSVALQVPSGYNSQSAVHFSVNFDSLEKPVELTVPVGLYFLIGGENSEIPPAYQHIFWRNPETNEEEEIPVTASWTKTGWQLCFIVSGAGDYVMVAVESDDHNHDYISEETAPTCTEQGYATYRCDCGDSYVDDYVDATGHVYADDTDVNCDQCGYIRNTSSEEDSESQEFPFSEWEWEVLKLTNDERLEMGLSPLTGFAKLQEATDIRAAELAQSFSHIRPDGTDCFTVLDEVGIPYYEAGENIAQGHTAPAWVMNSWMNSTGHRANILTDGFSHLGVGEINFNWVQIFLGSTGYYTSINVVPEEATVAIGTTINDMGLVAVLNSSVYGECYLPVVGSYCIGYDPDVAGAQTVTISVLGVSSTFEIYVKDHDHSWTNASCTTPETCIICGEIQGAPLGHSWIDASCTTPKYCSVCGSIDGTAIGHNYVDSICTNCGRNENEIETIPMYRLYNPYTQEHLLSSNEIEKNQLVSVGWSLDGIAWNAPIPGEPVYRLYNPFDDWHIYTVSQAEVDMLTPLGWTVDGVVSRSATKSEGVPIYRLFNPYEQKNYHLLTASEAERDYLVSLGWRYEGIGWYAIEN